MMDEVGEELLRVRLLMLIAKLANGAKFKTINEHDASWLADTSI